MLYSLYETFLPAKKNTESTWVFCVFFLQSMLFLFDPDLQLAQYHSHTLANWNIGSSREFKIKTSSNLHLIIGALLVVLLEKPAMLLFDQFTDMVRISHGSIQFLLDSNFYSTLPKKMKEEDSSSLHNVNRPYKYIRPTYSNPSFYNYCSKPTAYWEAMRGRSAQCTAPYCLPTELWFYICRFLYDPYDFIRLSQTCKFFHGLANEDVLWVDMYKRMNKGNYAKEAPNPSQSKVTSPNRSKRSHSLFEFRSASPAPDLSTEFNFYYWFNNQEKVNATQIKYHFLKQLQLIKAVVEPEAESLVEVAPLMEAQFGRILIRSGLVQMTMNRKAKTKQRHLFLFTDLFVIAKLTTKSSVVQLEHAIAFDLKKIGSSPPYHIFAYNRERILLCLYHQEADQLCIIQLDRESEYVPWVNDFKRLLRRANEYKTLYKNSNFGKCEQSSAVCYMCQQKASLIKRLYWCWSCGFVICANCTVVVPWHFQHGCICTMCDVDLKFSLSRLG